MHRRQNLIEFCCVWLCVDVVIVVVVVFVVVAVVVVVVAVGGGGRRLRRRRVCVRAHSMSLREWQAFLPILNRGDKVFTTIKPNAAVIII